MLRKLGVGFLIFILVLCAVGAGGYYWVKTRLWSEIQSVARTHGAELEKPGLALRWAGDLRFTVRMTDLKGELKNPLPVTGPFHLPLLEADLEVVDQQTRAIVYQLNVSGLTGKFHQVAGPTEDPPNDPPNDQLEIPKIEVPGFERPALPIALDLRDVEFSAGDIEFRQTGEGSELLAKLSGLRLNAKGVLDSNQTFLEASLAVSPFSVKMSSQSAPSNTAAEAQMKSVTVNFSSKNPEGQAFLIEPKVEAQAVWTKLAFEKTPAEGTKLSIADQGGEFRAQAEGANFEVRGRGQNLTASVLKKPTDWGFELKPLQQSSSTRAYRLTAAVPGLLDLKMNIVVPANFDPAKPEIKADGDVKLHTDLSLLVFDKNPSPWKTQITGKVKAALARSGDLSLQTQLRGEGLSLDLQAEANPNTQEAQASGFISMNFTDRSFEVAGIKPRGRVSAPFKLLLRQKKKFFFESELRLGAFAIATKDLRLEGLQGSLPIKQAWSFERGGWVLSPKLSLNAFARADFDSFEPLELRLNQLRIAQMTYEKRVYGPIVLDLKFDQNLLRSGSWSMTVGQGSIEGALQADLSLDNPRMGLLMRAFDVKLEELLPESMFRTSTKSDRGLSFRLGMDWDLGKATAVGRLDWSEINSAQVMQILDFLDPQFENATFNQARMVLAQAYPTRVQVEMRGPVADIRISTNLVALPEVRNVAISPYLVKANEALYSSEVYRKLRSPSVTPKTNLSPER